jgi:putative effector of murein hydrolase
VSESLLSLAERLFETPATSVVLTWLAYEIGRSAQARCRGSVLANPVLIAALLIVPVLEMAGVSYERYMRGAGFIHFLLGPAAARLLVGIGVGATVACVSAVVLAWLLGASADVVRSIAPKSVTTPIAIGISQEIGGQPSITVVLVIVTGIIGAMLSGRFFDWIGVHDPEARGIAAGVAGHGIATAQMISIDKTAGAFAGLAIGLTGLFTAILLPIAVRLLPLILPD